MNDEAYEKAKVKRSERRKARKEYAIAKKEKVRPFPNIKQTNWDECSGPPKELADLSEKLSKKIKAP